MPPCHPDTTFRVRPYTLTGGRTSPTVELPIAAEVRALSSASEPGGLCVALRRVLDVLIEPGSPAEVAARAGVPLPVALVLIDDLVQLGLVAVDKSPVNNDRSDIQLLRKVLEAFHVP